MGSFGQNILMRAGSGMGSGSIGGKMVIYQFFVFGIKMNLSQDFILETKRNDGN
jgi:hypothetical protein